ncbi:MAG: hypothetical protein WKH97_08575 [Casimicrobiaceae bacterium]
MSDQTVIRVALGRVTAIRLAARLIVDSLGPGLTTISDHVSLFAMESIPVSKFKATCLAVLQRVKRTGRPLLITRFGQPVAEVIPPRVRASRSEWLGAMAGRAEFSGDIVGPAVDAKTWAAMSR